MIEVAHDRDHRLLRGVGGVGLVPGDPPAHRVDTVVVTAEQLVECPTVSPLGCSHQLMVGELRCDGGETSAGQVGSKLHLGDVAAVGVLGALRRLRQLLEHHQHVTASAC